MMKKYEEIPLSKHDDDAYKGRMDRLTYSKNLYYIIEQLYEMQEEYLESTNEKELVNVLIREKNNIIAEIIKLIENGAVEMINSEYAFNDYDIYKYHYMQDNGMKEELTVESLLGLFIKHDEKHRYFKDLIYSYLHNNLDEENNSTIVEFAKDIEELKSYKNAREIFEHVMEDLLRIKDFD